MVACKALRRRRPGGDTDAPHAKVSQGSKDGLAFLQPWRPRTGRPAFCPQLERNTVGHSTLTLLASLSCICVLGAGCGSMQSPGSEASSGVPSNSIPSVSPAKPKPAADSDFDPKNFNHPLEITNQYFPMVPGTRLHWKGTPSTKMTAAELSGRSTSQSVT